MSYIHCTAFISFRPGPKLAELLQARKFHNVQIVSDDESKPENEQDTTVTQFNSVITDLQTAMKLTFTPSEEVNYLKWMGFLNLQNWPINNWRVRKSSLVKKNKEIEYN